SGWIWFAVGIGMGILTKGPVVILHVLPVALLAPLWVTSNAAKTRWWGWYGLLLLALLAGACIALLWAIPAAVVGGDAYAYAIFWGQSAGRTVQSFAHAR